MPCQSLLITSHVFTCPDMICAVSWFCSAVCIARPKAPESFRNHPEAEQYRNTILSAVRFHGYVTILNPLHSSAFQRSTTLLQIPGINPCSSEKFIRTLTSLPQMRKKAARFSGLWRPSPERQRHLLLWENQRPWQVWRRDVLYTRPSESR